MYKVQNSCDNCYHCSIIGYLEMCCNKESNMYNKEVEPSGICSKYKKGTYWEETENEKVVE